MSAPIIVGVSDVTFPYSFRDKDGELKGFAHDIGEGVAHVMHLRLQRTIMSPTEMGAALRDGKIDAIQWWGETAERRGWAEFSTPIIRFETVAVVRRGDTRVRTLADLKGRRVGVGQRGNVGWNYLVNEQPEAVPVFTDNSERFLHMLAAGEIDAGVMSRLTALAMIERLGLKGLTVLDDRIPGEKYDVRYCFTVRKGDSLLLARLNEGLAIVHRTGEFDRIYDKWFGRYEPRRFSREEVVNYALLVLLIACLAATVAYLHQRRLSQRIIRQAAELAVQRSQLAVLHDKHPLATVVLEIPEQGSPRLVSANHEATRLFSLDPTAAPLPQPLESVSLPATWRAHLADAIAHWRVRAQYHQWESQTEGGRHSLESSVVPLGVNETGDHRLCVLTADVTRRRLMEQEVAQSRRLRALGELVGGIAHEFNNLLTPVLMTASFARTRRNLDPESREGFVMIEQATRRAAELTRRLLTFGRRSEEPVQPVPFADAVNNCFALMRPTIDRRIEWTFTQARELPPIAFNAVDLGQIVFNLVINARDTLLEKLAHPTEPNWTPRLIVSLAEHPGDQGPSRAAGARTPAAWQHLTVEDNGCGIPPEAVDRIFEPFFTTKEVGKGTGLGLATVWHLVTEGGGDVTVESIPGAGSRFHVWLPRWTGPAAGEVAAPSDPPPANPHAARVLLVEDEPLVARSAMTLLRLAGHTVTHQPDGAEAWAWLQAHGADCDVIIADINMPRLSGVDLVRLARNHGYRGGILMISGRVSPEDKSALDQLGVDGFLNKPFSAEDLKAAVENTHRRT